MSNIIVKAHYDAETLASMAIPGLPTTRAAIFKRAKTEGWGYVEVPGKGGRGGIRKEYLPPTSVMSAIKQMAAKQLVSTVATSTPIDSVKGPDPRQIPLILSAPQGVVADARKGVLLALETLMNRSGYAMKTAARELLEMAQSGEANPQIINMLKAARDGRGRQSSTGLPSVRSVLRFVEYDRAGALVPRRRECDMSVPAWAPLFMECYQKPEKPTISHAYEVFLALVQERGFDQLPSIWQVQRFLAKVGKVSLQIGRMGDRELKTIRPFIRRSTKDMKPADVYSADGHTFDAEVQHPIHGRPFRPEITSIVDIATRRLVGWSVGLAESAFAVLDALRDASTRAGIPAIFYVDNGSGYKNHMMTDTATGLLGRLGIEMHNSIPYNSQARGVIERLHQTIWVKAAKELPGYMGRDMDRQASQAVHKLSRKAIKQRANGEVSTMPLIGWPGFLDFCKDKVEAYNNRPHRSLPKITDPTNGRQRNMTPNEAWKLAETKGFVPHIVTDDEARPLFRPQELRTIIRGEISLFSNRYFSRRLEEFNGEQLCIGYDIQDPSCVWVYDADGRFICTAELNGNEKPYMPQSVQDRARDKRAAGRERKAMNKLEEIRLERNGVPALEQMDTVHIPGLMKIDRNQLAQRAQGVSLVGQPPSAMQDIETVDVREVPDTAPEWKVPLEAQARYNEWLRISKLEEGELESEKQKNWRQSYTTTPEFRVYSRKTA